MLEPVLPAVRTDLSHDPLTQVVLEGGAGHARGVIAASSAVDRLFVSHSVPLIVDPAREPGLGSATLYPPNRDGIRPDPPRHPIWRNTLARTAFAGTGFYVPDRVVTNADLAELMDTSDEWIVERSGIRERRWVSQGMTGAEMARHGQRDGAGGSRPERLRRGRHRPGHPEPGPLLPGNRGLSPAGTGSRGYSRPGRWSGARGSYGLSVADA